MKSQSTDQENLRLLREERKELSQKLDILERENQYLRHKLDVIQPLSCNNEDIDIRSQELQLAELIIENSPAILFRRLAAEDPKDRKMVYVSPNISRFGYQAEDFLYDRIMYREIVFPHDHERLLIEIQAFVKKNIEAYTQFYRIITKDGELRWVEDRTSIVEDSMTGVRYHQGIVIDIHKRKVAEEKLRKSEEKYRRIVETAGEGFLLMDESFKVVDLNSAFANMVKKTRSQLRGQQPFASESEKWLEFWDIDQQDKEQEYQKFECELRTSDARKIPVLVHANSLRSDTGEFIGNMAFVTDLSAQKKALTLAGEVQKSLLPEKAPLIEGLDIAGRNVPCDEVGGDYFDYLWNAIVKESEFTVVVGDIAGHGVDSALLMSSARAFLRMRASQPGSIIDIVTDMNRHMTEDVYETSRFMTLLYLTIGKSRKSMRWIRAGHDPALLYDPELDAFEELKGPGMALGVNPEYVYQLQYKDGLKANQLIVVGTDGIWEGSSKEGEMFGKKRLKDIIRQNASFNAETILTAIFKEQADFTKGMKTEDDITLVVVKVV